MKGDYKELKIWQSSMELCKSVYLLTKLLPVEERYALSDQLRRSSVSVPSNIAEGHGRQSIKEVIQFLHIARGSLYELETQILLCRNIYNLNDNSILKILDNINQLSKMIASYIRYHSNSNNNLKTND